MTGHEIAQLQEEPAGKPWGREWVRDWEPGPFDPEEYERFAAHEARQAQPIRIMIYSPVAHGKTRFFDPGLVT